MEVFNMSVLRQFIDKEIEVEISGNHIIIGKLIDFGLDLMVLLHEQRFFYIPLVHVQNLKASSQFNEEVGNLPESPIDYQSEILSFRKILNHAKGRFVENYVTGDKTIPGYLTSIMNDYFVFYSPVYKAIFVSMNHLKWLIPYSPDLTPYSLSNQSLPVNPISISLSRTFEEQVKKLAGNLVVFDLGDNPDKVGLLQKADNQIIELVNANGEKVCWNTHHIKTVYIP
jgi:hypothetical protein